MRERLVEWGLLILAVVGVVVLVVAGNGTRGSFDSLVIGKDKWYEIISAREKTSEGMVSRVSFNREELITAREGEEWYYSLVERQENAKNPEVSYKAEEGVKLAVLEDKMTDEKIRSGEAIRVMAYSDSKYEMYELFVTTLPVMKISHTGPVDIAKSDGEVEMKMELFDNRAGATQRLTLTDGRIKVRGASSATYPKKGFRMKLKTMSVGESRRANNVSLLGMRQDDDWLLYAGYNDQEKVRNVFATNLWKEGQAKDNDFGLDNGTEYKYVEMIMEDEYYGLYALGYPVDELVMQLRKNKEGAYEEFSFKKTDWDETGDSTVETYELKTEVANVGMAWSELKNYDEILRYENNVGEIRVATDMRTAINFRLFVELVQATDNDAKNFFLTAKEWKSGYKWVYTPWDLDLALGNTVGGAYDMEAKDEVKVWNVATRLEDMGDEKVGEEIKAQYKKLRKGVWSEENLMEMIDEYEKEIYRSGAFSRDMERWPEGNYNDADEELTRFREYVLERLKVMDSKYL